jgi:hypothetical protein
MASKETDLEQLEMEDKPNPLQDGPFLDLNLKRSKKGIILRPQPSDDPNDPLVSKAPFFLVYNFLTNTRTGAPPKNTQHI